MITYKWEPNQMGGTIFSCMGGTPHFEGQMGGDKLPMGGGGGGGGGNPLKIIPLKN